MQNDQILLSVVVPTKNRYYYLKYLLDYVKEVNIASLEVIIQDNSDDLIGQKDFESWLKDASINNIVYEFVDYPLSVIENSDRAVNKVSGKYVMFIGDDDIFSQHVFDLIQYMEDNSIGAAFPQNSSYSWPSVKSRFYGDKLSGKYVHTAHTCEIKIMSAKSELKKVLKLGGTDILKLPRVYHGILRHDILKNIHNLTGSYFPGPSPDMANAVAVSILIDKYVLIDIPYIISGHSKQSTGGQGAEGKHFGEIKNIKHLPIDTADNWSAWVPFYWSGYTIYAESVLKSLERMNMDVMLRNFNFNYLYATCLVFDTNFNDRIWSTVRFNVGKSKNISLIKIGFLYLKVWLYRINYHLKHNLGYIFSKKNSKNILFFENIIEVARYNDNLILNKGNQQNT